MRNDGWTERSRVAVLADGADGLADLVSAVSPNACRSILDWFHISMRLRPIEQMVPKIAAVLRRLDVSIGEFILEKTPRVRYQMWNGQWHAAVRRMHGVYRVAKIGLKVEPAIDTERLKRFRRHLFEFKEYLRNNWKNLTNYAHAYRHGLHISSAPAESGMSHLVNQRMGKRQPMLSGTGSIVGAPCHIAGSRTAVGVSRNLGCHSRNSASRRPSSTAHRT